MEKQLDLHLALTGTAATAEAMSVEPDRLQPTSASTPDVPWVSIRRHGPDRLDELIEIAPRGDNRPGTLRHAWSISPRSRICQNPS